MPQKKHISKCVFLLTRLVHQLCITWIYLPLSSSGNWRFRKGFPILQMPCHARGGQHPSPWRIHGTGIIYLHLPWKTTIHVGKYASPMDPVIPLCQGHPRISRKVPKKQMQLLWERDKVHNAKSWKGPQCKIHCPLAHSACKKLSPLPSVNQAVGVMVGVLPIDSGLL